MNNLVRDMISLRNGEAGRISVSAYTAAGIGIVAMQEGCRFILAHVNSGYSLTPSGWFFAVFKQAAACVRLLVDQFGRIFEGDVRSIQTLSTSVLQAHRDAGAYTGRWHYLRDMNEQLGAEFEQMLEGLREQGKPWPVNEREERI